MADTQQNGTGDAGAGTPHDSSRDSGAGTAARRSRPALWPLIISALIICAFAACAWQLWSARAQAAKRAALEEQRIAELTRQKKELGSLLLLSPCEAKMKLAPAPPASPAPERTQGAAPVQTPQRQASAGGKVDNIEKGCVFLIASDGKSSLTTGSGFFVAPGYVVTNRHVVEAGRGTALVTSRGIGRPAVGKVVATSKGENEDYALLAVKLPPGSNVSVLPFAGGVQKTEKVGAWGYPDVVGKNDPAYAKLLRGEDFSATPELSYTEGVVSAVLPRTPKIIVHTAPISPGNSGGPLLNEAGEVVGINTMITLDDKSYRQASLALAASDLLRFLEAHGIKP